MATAFHEKKIKSADRVLEIFEMFNEERTAVTVMDVARALNAPQSSTSELLGSLVRRGYLVRLRGERVFRPTSRVALLGAWVHPALFRNGNLLQLMDSLRDETGMGVALCSMVGVSLKHLHTVGKMPDRLDDEGSTHLLHSPFGHALLSTMFSEDMRLLVQRLNAESEPDLHVRHADLAACVLGVSKRGSAIGPVAPGWTGIAVLLPQSMGEEQLALGLVGQTHQFEARGEEFLRALRQAISNYLGPRVASDNFVPAPLVRQFAANA
jgi:DNA-binding IclR family transcriptional regulator